jgi:putative DNA primase/helicase
MEDFDLGKQLENNEKTLEKEVKAIIGLDRLQREVERNRIAKKYDVRKSVIDEYIKEVTKKEEVGGTSEIVTEVEPASESISGDKLLSAIKGELLKYIILPGGVAEPITVWVVLTYCYDAFRILPNLGITSPVKRCGKTTLLEVLQGLTNKGLTASNISPAAVFRTIDKYQPTLLIDEADTFLKDNDELRGVLNSGHTKTTAFVIRVEGESHEPVRFSTWAPKAISMIGTLPETLQDRSVVIQLRRKAPGESASKLDIDFEAECLDIRRKCQRWADDNLNELTMTRPEMPKTNNDRMTDNWMPLSAIAEVAGGDWPGLIKKSMLKMLDISDDNIGCMLLEDIKDILSNGTKRIFSDDLVEALKDKSDRPWCDWNRGKGLTQNGLARLLKPFDVKSKTIRIEDKQRKGYSLEDFTDAFKRYISSFSSIPPVSSVPTLQSKNINKLGEKQSVSQDINGTDEKQHNLLNIKDCYVGTDEKGGAEKNIKETDVPLWKKLRFDSEEDYLKMIS